MILTTCAVCAAPLADEAPAHCVNCQTRYDSAVSNLIELLGATREFEEAKSLAREKIPAIINRHGPDHTLTLEVRTWYARALFLEGEDLSEAATILEDVWRRSRRVLGEAHPETERARKFLEEVRSARVED